MGRLNEDIAKDGSLIIGTGTKAAKDKGFQILGSNTWSNKVNDAWVQGGIDAKRTFDVTSSPEWINFRNKVRIDENGNFSRGDYPKTVFMREMLQLRDAGYRLIDGKMVPPKD